MGGVDGGLRRACYRRDSLGLILSQSSLSVPLSIPHRTGPPFPRFSSLNRALPRLDGESWSLRLRCGGPQKLPLSISAQLSRLLSRFCSISLSVSISPSPNQTPHLFSLLCFSLLQWAVATCSTSLGHLFSALSAWALTSPWPCIFAWVERISHSLPKWRSMHKEEGVGKEREAGLGWPWPGPV